MRSGQPNTPQGSRVHWSHPQAGAASSSSGNWIFRNRVGSPTVSAIYVGMDPSAATNANCLMYYDSGYFQLGQVCTQTTIAYTGGSVAIFNASGVEIDRNTLSWHYLMTPTIKQNDNTTASAVGATFTLRAQNCTGSGSTGANLALSSGSGISGAGNTLLQTGGTTIGTITPSVTYWDTPLLARYSSVAVAALTAYNTSATQGAYSYNNAFGCLYLGPDNAPLAKTCGTNYTLVLDSGSGVTQLHAAYATTGAKDGVLNFSVGLTSVTTAPTVMAKLSKTGFQLNYNAIPSGAPSAGSGYLFVDATGALCYWSSSGKLTQIAT